MKTGSLGSHRQLYKVSDSARKLIGELGQFYTDLKDIISVMHFIV